MILFILCKKLPQDLCCELDLAFCSTQPSTKVLSLTSKNCCLCRHSCHTWDVGLGTLCEVASLNFHALNSWDCIDLAQVNWDLGLGTCVNRPLLFHSPPFPPSQSLQVHFHNSHGRLLIQVEGTSNNFELAFFYPHKRHIIHNLQFTSMRRPGKSQWKSHCYCSSTLLLPVK